MVGGALFFGYFFLSKQKKVTRLEAKKNGSRFTVAPLPNPLPLAGEGTKKARECGLFYLQLKT
jgi:hypothetical protein